MRITDRIVAETLLSSISRTRNRMNRYQKEMATSKRIDRPSDDPRGAARSMTLRSSLTAIDQYRRNVKGCLSWMSATESALSNMETTLIEIQSLVLPAVPENAPERDAIAVEVDQLLEYLVSLSGKRFEGMYLFGGTERGEPYTASYEVTEETLVAAVDAPVEFDHPRLAQGTVQVMEAGGGATFVEDVDYTIDHKAGTITVLGTGAMSDGATYEVSYQTTLISSVEEANTVGRREREIDEGMKMIVNTSGHDVFNREVDIFDTLIRLRDGLYREDTAAIKHAYAQLDPALDQVLRTSTIVGTKIQKLEVSDQRLEREMTHLSATLSDTEDTDLADTIVRFQTDENAYQAAIQAGARMIQQTLIDYLG